MEQKPIVFLHFDNLVYKKGRCFKGCDEFFSLRDMKKIVVPRPTSKMKTLFEQIKDKYNVILYSEENFFYALMWVLKNRLENKPINSVSRIICPCAKVYGAHV